MRRTFTAFLVIILVAILVTYSEATPIDSVTPSGTASQYYDVNSLIDGSGLSGDYHDNDFNNMWLAGYDYGDKGVSFR